ncbi:hypothetical protein CAOG_01467 [Capsaspora owczarzaki ATCC 30864]|uniref:hypothetical protein n=1 Tax=Capsaspora owczarzaki (strain ATCC 30864) TaxID=595528 RepID=UPI0003525A01|nr:hypothetical protein CAOG_01467 [Capsaspora owczarzaki ATCC 30864]|eukprot:XP_004364335.2 hypothetical protein CAOG_01467 [Capsaspora owczarzaki ATCC 30864]
MQSKKPVAAKPSPSEGAKVQVGRALIDRELAHLTARVDVEKRAFAVQKQLLEGNMTEESLRTAAMHILPSHYTAMTEERALMGRCGYPMCHNPPQPATAAPASSARSTRPARYTIDRKVHVVYDLTEWRWFCSDACFQASKFFESQISSDALWLRNEQKPRTPIKLLPIHPKAEDRWSSDSSVKAAPSGNPEGSPQRPAGELLFRERQGAEVIAPAVRPADAHDAIEGYRPTFDQIGATSGLDDDINSLSLQEHAPRTPKVATPQQRQAKKSSLLNSLINTSAWSELCLIVSTWQTDAAVAFLHGHVIEPRLRPNMTAEEQTNALLDYAQLALPTSARQPVASSAFASSELIDDDYLSDSDNDEPDVDHFNPSNTTSKTPASAQSLAPRPRASDKSAQISKLEQQPASQADDDLDFHAPLTDAAAPALVRRGLFLSQLTKEITPLLSLFHIPVADIQSDVSEFVALLDLRNSNSSLTSSQWKTTVLLFLRLLAFRNPKLGQLVVNTPDNRFEQLVAATGLSSAEFQALVVMFEPRML